MSKLQMVRYFYTEPGPMIDVRLHCPNYANLTQFSMTVINGYP